MKRARPLSRPQQTVCAMPATVLAGLNPVPMPVVSATGEIDAEGAPVMTPVPGYHGNTVCRGACPEALEQWRVYPETPFAVLA